MKIIEEITRLLNDVNEQLTSTVYPNVEFLHGQQVAYTKCLQVLKQENGNDVTRES